ncbi:hypothetical protein ACMAZF_16495 [Psychrobium sp. nBUS_13]|uniref:hypothetical protein n=1 Tax=Psychrobium sp. nBUS_13 TaxID=3395319 RepID=UPI003EBBBEC4
MKSYHIVCLLLLLSIGGCTTGYQGYVNVLDDKIGTKMHYKKPFKYKNAGQLKRANFVITGQGLTEITKKNEGDLIYHFNNQEILPNFSNKDLVGKCLIYYVVDSKTYIIKRWGFDKGGNPSSCRMWP